MALRTQHPTPEYSPAVLTHEQRRRVVDALKEAQSENTRKNYASQFRRFRAWCELEGQSALPAQPEVVAGQRQLFWPLYANYFGRSGCVIVACNCRSCASLVR